MLSMESLLECVFAVNLVDTNKVSRGGLPGPVVCCAKTGFPFLLLWNKMCFSFVRKLLTLHMRDTLQPPSLKVREAECVCASPRESLKCFAFVLLLEDFHSWTCFFSSPHMVVSFSRTNSSFSFPFTLLGGVYTPMAHIFAVPPAVLLYIFNLVSRKVTRPQLLPPAALLFLPFAKGKLPPGRAKEMGFWGAERRPGWWPWMDGWKRRCTEGNAHQLSSRRPAREAAAGGRRKTASTGQMWLTNKLVFSWVFQPLHWFHSVML